MAGATRGQRNVKPRWKREVILVETNFEQMTEAELRFAALRFESLHVATGDEAFSRLADEVDDLRMRRMLANPNPYEKGGQIVANS